MNAFASSLHRPARSGLRPGVEDLEGRLCMSTVGLHLLSLHPLAAPHSAGMTGHHLAAKHSVHHQGTNSGGASPSVTAIGSASAQTPTSTTSSGGNGYVYTREGNPVNVPTSGQGGLALEGGGTDINQVFAWMASRMRKPGDTSVVIPGDFLVIRATNDTGYNDYLYTTVGGFNSVATLDIPNRAAASNPAVIAIIESAGALFIGGGNQADYVKYWEGTPVQTAINYDVAHDVPLGGTSAGTDVIGQYLYSAEGKSITSSEALNNPFDPSVTLDQDFVDPSLVPSLNNTILDTHLVTRDRMGRMVAFLARIDTNGWSTNNMPIGIGINEQTALEITPGEPPTVVANSGAPDPYVYFLRTPGLPQVCQKNVPLTYASISVDRVGADTSSLQYTISVSNGVLSSTQQGGAIY
jgi:cyanophycinase-like exopeptidase